MEELLRAFKPYERQLGYGDILGGHEYYQSMWPHFQAHIHYAEETDDGRLRFPAFKGYEEIEQ